MGFLALHFFAHEVLALKDLTMMAVRPPVATEKAQNPL